LIELAVNTTMISSRDAAAP